MGQSTLIKKAYNFNVNISFDTKTPITERTLKVSDAFGLGIKDNKQFVVYKDFNISFDLGDVIYITGDSGGGKSLLLNYIKSKLMEQGELIFELENPDKDEILIESIGEDENEAVEYLSIMGLNDAFIFLRRFCELSDGQKYRYRLAKLISKSPKFIFIDEFCANLDRTTAKVISFNLQKVARKNKIALFVATTHRDLESDLNSSVLIDKKYMNEVSTKYYNIQPKKISFYDDVLVTQSCVHEYEKLSKFHYKDTSKDFPYSKIFKASYNGELVGVIVFSPPFLQNKGRNIKFNYKYSKMTTEVTSEINKLFIRISRVIISPKYRACGLGQKIMLDSINQITDKKYIEMVSVMGKYNPFADKIGMEKIELNEDDTSVFVKIDKFLKENNCTINKIHNETYFKSFLDALTLEKKEELKCLVSKGLIHPKLGISGSGGRREGVLAEQKRYSEHTFEEVKSDIVDNIVKLYSGNTIYYILENPNYYGFEV